MSKRRSSRCHETPGAVAAPRNSWMFLRQRQRSSFHLEEPQHEPNPARPTARRNRSPPLPPDLQEALGPRPALEIGFYSLSPKPRSFRKRSILFWPPSVRRTLRAKPLPRVLSHGLVAFLTRVWRCHIRLLPHCRHRPAAASRDDPRIYNTNGSVRAPRTQEWQADQAAVPDIEDSEYSEWRVLHFRNPRVRRANGHAGRRCTSQGYSRAIRLPPAHSSRGSGGAIVGSGLGRASTDAHAVQGGAGGDEEGEAVWSTESQGGRALGNFDGAEGLARRIEDPDMPSG